MKKEQNPELVHSVNLVLGDWSGDGHSKTSTVAIKSNLDAKYVEKAYKKGVKKTGVDFQEVVARDYEDSTIEKETVDQLVKFGFNVEDYSEDQDELPNGSYGLYEDGYALAWLWMCKIGDPKFEYEIVEDNNSTINIGGYGLWF